MKQLYTHLKVALTFVVMLASFNTFAQNVGINSTGAAPNASAGLDVSFTNKGVLIPNVALTGTTDVSTISSPATSLLVYNTANVNNVTAGYYYYSGTAWVRLATGTSSQWTTTGSNLYFNTGNVAIGTNNPSATYKLVVNATSNPLLLNGVQTGASSDSILTIAGSIVKKIPAFSSQGWTLSGNSTTNTNFLGTINNQSIRFRTNNTQAFYIDSLGNAAVGASPTFSSTREKFLVDAGSSTSSYNVISGKGTINNYLQLNIQNRSNGTAASSDIVATNDTGTESANYVDLGINSSGNTSTGILGGANTGYLYSIGSDFAIGNASLGKTLKFFNGGIADTNEKMRIAATGKIGIGITDPSNNLVVKDTLEIRRTGTNISNLIFSNTAGTGDFRIAGDGGDLFWQGGGTRALQMGSYWTTILAGDRQTGTLPAYVAGSSYNNIGVLVAAQRDASAALVVRGNSATQTANLTEWQTSAGSILGSFTPAGNLGVGVASPSTKLHIMGTNPVRFDGITAGTSADSILTMQSGVLKRVSPTLFSTTLTGAWNRAGNGGVGASEYLGTSDSQPLRIRTNNTQRMIVAATGNVGIGTGNPLNTLTVTGTNPLGLFGVQTGAVSDSILTMSSGVVKRWTSLSTSTWLSTGNTGTTSTATTGNFLGTTDSQPLRFRTADAQRMMISSAGNVGIGMNTSTTPAYRLAVYSTSNPVFLSGVQVGATNDSTLTSLNGVVRRLGPSWSTAGNTGTTEGTHFVGTTDNKDLVFKTNNTEAMRIGSDGNVGIGADPGTDGVLVIDGGTAPSSQTLISADADMNDYIQFNIKNTNNGDNASTDIVATASNGSETAAYIDMGINSAGYATASTKILNGANTAYLYANAGRMYVGNAAQSQPLIFFTNSTGSSGDDATGTERMRIQSNGTVGIGYSQTSQPSSSYKLDVSGDVRIVGTVYYNGQSQMSDRRLKTNIVPTHYGLKDVMLLQPVEYNWKTNPTDDRQIGLIAQDLRKIVPEAVKGDESKENLSVDYIKMIPLLINSIKEQQKQIDDLKKVVADLQKK